MTSERVAIKSGHKPNIVGRSAVIHSAQDCAHLKRAYCVTVTPLPPLMPGGCLLQRMHSGFGDTESFSASEATILKVSLLILEMYTLLEAASDTVIAFQVFQV